MSRRKSGGMFPAIVLAVSLFASSVTAVLMTGMYSRIQFHVLSSVCSEILRAHPEMEKAVLSSLKNLKCIPDQRRMEMYCWIMATGHGIF